MEQPRRIVATWIILMLAALAMSVPESAPAQYVVGKGYVNLPGIGPVNLDDLSLDLRDKIRIPGELYEEPAEQYGDLPAANKAPDDDVAVPLTHGSPAAEEPLTVFGFPPPKGPEERKARAEAVERMYPPEGAFSPLEWRPPATAPDVPDDAYLRALEHIEMMSAPAASAPEPQSSVPEPQSWLLRAGDLLASAWGSWFASPGFAQGTPCTGAPTWTPVGPAPFLLYSGLIGQDVKNAGIVKHIAVDPRDSQRLYLGARNSGLWQSTDGGTSVWRTTTDNLPLPNKTSLQIEAIAVHPTNSNVILAGTGLGPHSFDGGDSTPLSKSIGVLRSTDGGSTWAQIGPTWCTTSDTACRTGGTCSSANPAQCPGTNPTNSTINVKELFIDTTRSPLRVWAATSMGVWYSDNALNPATASNQVVWTRKTSTPAKADGSPEIVYHLFVSPLNNQVLYMAINEPGSGNNGWYRSANTGGTWSPINNGLPANPSMQDAAIARGGVSGADTLYTIVADVSTPQCGGTRSRVYRTTDSGQNWVLRSPTGNCEGQACDGPICDCCISVQVDPRNPSHVFAGGTQLYRSTDGWASASRVGAGIIHVDQNRQTFDPSDPNIVYVGNDGGIWKYNFATDAWTFLHGNLANAEFYTGGIDTLNYGNSGGGTQDNGSIKGGAPLVWRKVSTAFGDGVRVLFDPTDSNTMYFSGFGGMSPLQKSTDGGNWLDIKTDGLAAPVDVHSFTPALDPTDNRTLVLYSVTDKKVFRTTTAAEPPPTPGSHAWVPISPQILSVERLAVAPTGAAPSPLMFAGTNSNSVWRTTNASAWARMACPGNICQLPGRAITSFAFGPSPSLCSATTCTVYVTLDRFNDAKGGHVFRSADAGQNWQDISGSGSSALPDVPANAVVAHPSDSNVVFVATDAGIYKGTFSGSTWSWCPFTSGFPKTALVKDLKVHAESGLLRAFSYGRSAWEVQAFPIPDPDLKVNSTTPVTDALSPRLSSGDTGQLYGLAWADDRIGANNWHIYYRAYQYDQNGRPTSLATELRVDDTSAHTARAPALVAHPTQTSAPYCARVAWQDDRLSPGLYQHIYYQHVCSNGYKLYTSDVRADQHATDINATNPAIAQDASTFESVVTWQADRSAGSALHDIYARFLDLLGGPKGPQIKINTSSRDATSPAAATVGTSMFIAWEELDSATLNGTIWISKYNLNGTKLVGPVQVNTQGNFTERHQAAVAVDSSGQVLVAWWERKSDGTQPEAVFHRRFTNGLSALDPQQVRANQPPAFPPGVNRAVAPAVATDTSLNFVVAWQANVNASDASAWSGFGRSFGAVGTPLKNDFRIDLHGRATAGPPRLARSSLAGQFVYAWRDNRSGHFDIYTRVVPSL